jgi:inner membrane transporter RhtA
MKYSRSLPTFPPTSLVLMSIAITQFGSAFAKSLFATMNPIGVVLLRVGFAAIVLLLLWRPQVQASFRSNARALILFGLSLGLMNFCFYLAIARIPMGIAVALEFAGPLGVAIANSRQRLDLVWAAMAAIGIVLLAPVAGSAIDPVGVVLALLAGGLWATYILLSVRVGKALPGGSGLALAMAIAALILLPGGIWASGWALLNPKLLLLGFGVAMLSSAIPYSLELEALRFLPVQVFGVLLSLEPVAAALTGFIVLRETLSLRSIVAIVLITIAAAGSSRFAVQDSGDR